MSRLLARRSSGGPGGGLQVAMPPKLQVPVTMKLQAQNEVSEDPHAKLTNLNEKFVITSEVLGSGTSAVVKRATLKDNPSVEVAVKLMNTGNDEGLCDIIQREFDLVRELRHPSIVQAYELFIAPDRTLAGLCMELVRGSTLKVHVQQSGAIAEDTMRPLFKQLVAGLCYLHQKRIIHRDLKPDNLLIEKKLDRLRICDFNVARNLADGGTLTPLVTEQQFTAPEVLLCDAKMGERSDIWGAGVCLHYALTGGMTFALISKVEHYSPPQLGRFLTNISEQERLKWIEKPGLSWDSPAVNVLWGCTHPDVSQRPEPSLLMAHPWLSQIADVPGQECVDKFVRKKLRRNLRAGVTQEAMETCAIRVCSIGFGSNPSPETWQQDGKETQGHVRFLIDSLGNIVSNGYKDGKETNADKSPIPIVAKSIFWTAPNVEDSKTTEDDLFDTSQLDKGLYTYHDLASPTDFQSPKSIASPKSLASPKNLGDDLRSSFESTKSAKSDASPKQDLSDSSQQSADQMPSTLAAAIERLARGSQAPKGQTKTKDHSWSPVGYFSPTGDPHGILSPVGNASPQQPIQNHLDASLSEGAIAPQEVKSEAAS